MLNVTFDGDTVAIYRIHDIEATKQLESNAYLLNCIQYDHNGEFIQQIRLENLYGAYVLLNSKYRENEDPMIIVNLDDLPDELEMLVDINRPVLVHGVLYSYGVCVFNKWCEFKLIHLPGYVGPNEISAAIFQDCSSNLEYHQRLNELNKCLAWFISTHPKETITLSLNEIGELNLTEHKKIFNKLPLNPYIGHHIYEAVTQRIYNDIPPEFQLNKLTHVKVRKTQLSRMIGAIGYIADDNNVVNNQPLTGSIFDGLNTDMFFLTALGTRKGIVDKSNATPESGYLERSMVINLSPISLGIADCGTNIGFSIAIEDPNHVRSLLHRWYLNNDSGQYELYEPTDIKSEVGKTYIFRSPMTCANPDFKVCQKCFGNYNIPTPYYGVLAGQYIAERMTQLSMRTFHTSGSCTLPTDPTIVDVLTYNLVDIEYDGLPERFGITDLKSGACDLIFNRVLTPIEVDKFSQIIGYETSLIINNQAHVLYTTPLQKVENHDVTKIISEVKSLLRTQTRKNMMPIDEVYQTYIRNILSVGKIYSSFIEVVLCNMYLTKDNEVIRYALQRDLNAVVHRKLSIKKLHSVVSRLLGLLYEPNEVSIGSFTANSKLNQVGDTVLERMWQGSL